MSSARSGGLGRIVFDTSSLIGAVLRPQSVPAKALECAGALGELIASRETIAELADVLQRPELDRFRHAALRADFLVLYRAVVVEVEVTQEVADCRDPKDDKFLSLALTASASVIVSSDGDLLELNPWRGIPIVSPSQFLAMTADSRQ